MIRERGKGSGTAPTQRYMELTFMFTTSDFFISGIAPFGTNYVSTAVYSLIWRGLVCMMKIVEYSRPDKFHILASII